MAFLLERPIPERPYFKVGEVAHILGVVPSTVRYWQKEFPDHIRPEVSMSGQNVFSRSDVIVMAVILNLVRIDGISLKEARTALTGIIREHEGKVENIMLCQQFELELADGTSAPSTATSASQPATPAAQPPADTVPDWETPARDDAALEEFRSLALEVQSLEDENTMLREQLALRVREIATLRQELADADARSRALHDQISSIAGEILQSLGNRAE